MVSKEKIISVLKSYRYLVSDIINNYRVVEKDLSSLFPTKHMVHSCDVIDLRDILEEEMLKGNEYITLFPLRFSEKYLKKYPISLVIDVSRLKQKSYTYGGLKVFEGDELDVQDSIYRLIVNEPIDENTKQNIIGIISDTNSKFEILTSNSIPGISGFNPKSYMEKNMNNKNWYNKSKISQTVPISSHEEPIMQEDEKGVTKGPEKAIFPFEEGMKVRDRRGGVALPQHFGIVKEIQNNKMTIEWHKDKKRYNIDYNLDDTAAISAIVAEV
jgi:hypothetical protein